MATIIVLSIVFGILLIGFLWFYWYSRTLAWGESETRKAMLRTLIVVGPIFGMHYEKPVPERPTIATPKLPEDTTMPGIEVTTPEKPE